jgi:hypothetical protein
MSVIASNIRAGGVAQVVRMPRVARMRLSVQLQCCQKNKDRTNKIIKN